MKIGIVGSRSITDYSEFMNVMRSAPENWQQSWESFFSGGADGVDTMAEKYARDNKYPIEVIEPDYGDWSGGHPAKVRNTDIVEESDAIIAVWDGTSNGTRDTIDKALDRGVPIYVEIVE